MRICTASSSDANSRHAVVEVVEQLRADLDGKVPDLVLLFASGHHADWAGDIASTLYRDLKPVEQIGCIARGVVSGEREFENTPSLSVWAASIPEAEVESFWVPARIDEQSMSFEIPKPESSGPGWMVVLGDPVSFPGGKFVEALHQWDPELCVLGGMTSGAGSEGECLIDGETVVKEGAVCATLRGDLAITPVVSHACRPFGPVFTVTSMSGPKLVELGGIPAAQALKAALATLSATERELFVRGLHIARLDEPGNLSETNAAYVVRNVTDIDEKSGKLEVNETISIGQSVQFLLQDPDAASKDLERALEDAKQEVPGEPLGALLFPCTERGLRMFGRADHDTSVFARKFGKLPVAGFFADGELGPVGDGVGLHSFSLIGALFCTLE